MLLFLSPPEGDTGADTGSHTDQTDREEYPPRAARRSRFGGLGSGFRSGLGRGGGGRGGACLNFRNGDRFRLGATADRADALLLAFLAFRRLLRDGPVAEGVLAGFREKLAAAGIFLRVLRLGDGPFRHAAVCMVRAVDIAVSLAADLALCPPEAGRRAAGMFPRGGDRRAGTQQSIAAFAVCIPGVSVLRAGGFRRAAHLRAAHMVGGVLFAVGLMAYLAHGRVFACRRAAGVSRGGDHRAGGQQGIAVLAVGISGIARCRAGGFHRAADLFVAGVVVGVKIAPLVYIRLRSLVVAGAAVLVVHRLRDAGGRRLKIHVAQPERMRAIIGFPFGAVEAANPVVFGVSSYVRVRAPVPACRKSMIGMEVRSAANGASAVCAAVRGAAVAVSRFNRAAALALAGAGVGVVAVGLPIAPDVAENAVLSAAQRAGFARGAGGLFGAASMFIYTTIIISGAYARIFKTAVRTSNECPMKLWIRNAADRGGSEPDDQKVIATVAAFSACGSNPQR